MRGNYVLNLGYYPLQNTPRHDEDYPRRRVQYLAGQVQAKTFRDAHTRELRGVRGHSLPDIHQPRLRDQV